MYKYILFVILAFMGFCQQQEARTKIFVFEENESFVITNPAFFCYSEAASTIAVANRKENILCLYNAITGRIINTFMFRPELVNLLYPKNDSSIVPIRLGDGSSESEGFGAIDVDYSLLNENSLFKPRIQSGVWISDSVLRLVVHMRILLYRKAIDRTSVSELMTYVDYDVNSNKVVELKDVPFGEGEDAVSNTVLLSTGQTLLSRMYPVAAHDGNKPMDQYICREFDFQPERERYLLMKRKYFLPRRRMLLAASCGEDLYLSFDSCKVVVNESGDELIGKKTFDPLDRVDATYEVHSLVCSGDTLWALVYEIRDDRCVSQNIVFKAPGETAVILLRYEPYDNVIVAVMIGPGGACCILKGDRYTMARVS